MKKLYSGIAIMAMSGLISNAKAQDVGAQIDALQNEILKMKEQMSKGDKSKAYFEKGKGLRIKSTDGKYKFQIKGRIMYDVGGLLDYDGTLADGTTGKITEAGLGSEFRSSLMIDGIEMVISCGKCKFYFTTHDTSRPWGCNKFGFKSKNLPNQEVRRATGIDCAYFIPRTFKKNTERQSNGN